jgi:hypothetical protein
MLTSEEGNLTERIQPREGKRASSRLVKGRDATSATAAAQGVAQLDRGEVLAVANDEVGRE